MNAQAFYLPPSLDPRMFSNTPPRLQSREEAVERVTQLLPQIRARAAKTEADRGVPSETIGELIDSGVFGVIVPKKFGGSELGFAALVDVAVTLASACGSTGWVFGVLSSHCWLLAHFPQAAQEEVFADPRALTATVFRMAGQAVKVEGGYRLTEAEGRFCSGIDHSQWVILGNSVIDENGRREPRYFLLPISDIEIVDDWYTVGMRGTGSRTIRVRDAFIPEHRSVPFADLLNSTGEGVQAYDSAFYHIPFNNAPPLALVGIPIGIARDAVHVFAKSMEQKIAGYSELEIAQQSATFARIGEAAAEIDAAYALILENANRLDRLSDPASMPPVEKEKAPRDMAFAAQKCRNAVNSLFEASGGSGAYSTSEIQRIWRDVNAAAGHFAFTWDSAATNFGRTLLGLSTNQFVLKGR